MMKHQEKCRKKKQNSNGWRKATSNRNRRKSINSNACTQITEHD